MGEIQKRNSLVPVDFSRGSYDKTVFKNCRNSINPVAALEKFQTISPSNFDG